MDRPGDAHLAGPQHRARSLKRGCPPPNPAVSSNSAIRPTASCAFSPVGRTCCAPDSAPRSSCRTTSPSAWPAITPPSRRSCPPMSIPKSAASSGANRATPMCCDPCCVWPRLARLDRRRHLDPRRPRRQRPQRRTLERHRGRPGRLLELGDTASADEALAAIEAEIDREQAVFDAVCRGARCRTRPAAPLHDPGAQSRRSDAGHGLLEAHRGSPPR